jgi:hypothetical protein
MPGFRRKRGLTLTLYKKPFRYRLPVSPPRKRTKTRSSTPNLNFQDVLNKLSDVGKKDKLLKFFKLVQDGKFLLNNIAFEL